MIFSTTQKNNFFTILFTLFLTVLITACSTEENFSADQENTTPTTEVDTGINENNPAEISGVDSGSVTEDLDPDNDNLLEVDGKLTVVDIDVAESAFIAMTSTGDYGSLTINNTGTWHYSIENNLPVVQNLSTGSSLIDRISVSSVDGTNHQISITILGVNEINQPAMISGIDTGSVTEDNVYNSGETLTTGGRVNITDNDVGEEAFIAQSKSTYYGNFIIYSSGLWLYTANNNQAIIQNLTSGQTLTDSININSIDGTSHTITITIIGADEPNTPAVITGTDRRNLTEDIDPDNDNFLETAGQVNIIDPDTGEASFISANISGNYGNLVIDASGNWHYSADNNQSAIQNLNSGSSIFDILTISSIDGTTHVITITINGTDEANNPAVISGVDSASVTEDTDPDNDGLLEVNAKLNISDPDSGQAAFIASSISGNYGSLNINTQGNWNYAANNNQSIIQNLTSGASLVDTIIVSSIDDTTHTISITIIGVDEENTPAVITGVNSGSVTEDTDPDNDGLLEANAKLNISDPDSGESSFNNTNISGNYGNLVIDASGNWHYSADNNQSAIQNLNSGSSIFDILTISSIDGTTHVITITINGADEVNNPAVISGVDSASVTEDTDPDNDGLLEANAKLNISDPDSGQSTFISSSTSGNYGILNIDAQGNWDYTANNNQNNIQNINSGESLIDTFTISSVDGTTHQITIFIFGIDETNNTPDITLTWLAPAEREDNTAINLSEIAGYKIYYGSEQGQLNDTFTINDGTATSHRFEDFSTGTYYFVITTIDTDGRESQKSTEVQFEI